MYKSISAGVFCLLSFSATEAFADTTFLRCFYKASTDTTNTDFDYEWGLKSSSSFFPTTIKGQWWNNAIMNDPANMFYTDLPQSTLKTYCQNAFTKKGVTQPLMWMAAGSTSASLNYTIWSNDLSASQPNGIGKLIVFGDSASDNQNLYSGTQQLMPYHGSWFLGHFTNGKVWNEYLADNLNIPNYNWAVAGAAADDYLVIPGLEGQVDSYLGYMQSAPNYQPEKSLFTMFIGGNDLVNYERSVASILANERAALIKLIDSGARNILVLNLPAFDRAPVFVDSNSERDDADTIRSQILELNSGLVALVSELKAQYAAQNINVNLHLYNVKSQVDAMLNNPAAYGKSNVTESCLELNNQSSANYLMDHARRPHCTDADSFVFWDRLHPTTHAHKIIGEGLNGQGGVAAFVRAHYPL